MTYVWLTLVCVVMMIIFIIPTLMGGKWHDEQKAIRDRAEQARLERLKQERLSDQERDRES